MKKKEDKLKKQGRRKNSRKKELNPALLTPEQKDFLEREEKIDKINTKLNKPIIGITYLFGFLFLAMIGYIVYFMSVEKDQILANAANPRLDSYAENVNRGDIVTSDGKVIATGDSDERSYPYGDLFCHAVGYASYTKAGIELVGNNYLIDSHSNIAERFLRTLRDEKNEGDTVVSTLNYEMQQTAYNALGNADGAVVVMEPDTGKILAMVSKPDFDPNNIDEVWKEANSEGSTSSVLLNRASQGLYPPGSTFKVLTTLAYMRQYPNDYENYSYNCVNEENVFNGVTVHCFGRKTHGTENLADALANSCNQAYADIGTQLDVDEWRDMLETFSFNKNLPYVDASATSRFYLDGSSDKGFVPQTAFGQGDTLITPLHNAMIMSTIANGGLMMKPYMIDSIETYKGTRIKKFSPSSYETLMEPEEVEVLSTYLRGVVTSGTAASYFDGAPYEAAGKTGTAEYSNGEHDFSWFVGYANVDDPDIVVSVVVEESDVNGIKATAVARQLMDKYYSLPSGQ